MSDPLADVPVVVSIPVAWGDMDAYQHVNNTVYLRWFETARIAFFDHVGWSAAEDDGGPGPILARTSCVYRAPVVFPDTVRVGVTASDLGEDRFTTHYTVVSERQGTIVAHGDGRIVSFDYAAGAKAPIPEAVRRAIAALG